MPYSRRDVLRGGLGCAAGLLLSGPGLARAGGLKPFLPRRRKAGGTRTVVLVNLFGGNDSLNAAVPLAQYARYKALRPKLAIPEGKLLALPGGAPLALNPGMGKLRDLYAAGKVALIPGVGVPEDAGGLFDHSAAQAQFQTGNVASQGGRVTGWLGRYVDGAEDGLVAGGIEMGGGRLPVVGAAKQPLSIRSIEQLSLQMGFDEEARLAAYRAMQDLPRPDSAVAEQSRLLRLTMLEQSAVIRERTAGYEPSVAYPDSELGRRLRQAAQLVSGDLGVRAITVGTGGYDTHSDQRGDVDAEGLGYHDRLLQDVSDSLWAFQADLENHGLADQAMTLVVSEFARRAYENVDAGTDHGYGQTAIAVGTTVVSGVHGAYPSLAESDLVFDGNIASPVDFRAVYGTAVSRFLGGDAAAVMGGTFPTLGFA